MNNNQNRGPANYLRTSSLSKTIHFNNEVDQQTGKPVKQKQEFSSDVTEEISFTLTYEKATELLNRIQSAMNDQTGTGGIRLSMYCRKSQNQNTGEVFDGAGILVYATKPMQRGGGNFRGSGRGNFRGGGRRDYPPRQAQGYGQPQQQRFQQQPQQPAPVVQAPPPAQQATQQHGGYTQPVPQHGGQVGNGPTAQTSASPSEPVKVVTPQVMPRGPF